MTSFYPHYQRNPHLWSSPISHGYATVLSPIHHHRNSPNLNKDWKINLSLLEIPTMIRFWFSWWPHCLPPGHPSSCLCTSNQVCVLSYTVQPPIGLSCVALSAGCGHLMLTWCLGQALPDSEARNTTSLNVPDLCHPLYWTQGLINTQSTHCQENYHQRYSRWQTKLANVSHLSSHRRPG